MHLVAMQRDVSEIKSVPAKRRGRGETCAQIEKKSSRFAGDSSEYSTQQNLNHLKTILLHKLVVR